MKTKLIILLLISILTACKWETEPVKKSSMLYFDVQGFFSNEAVRLNNKKPIVDKYVSVNSDSEHKKVSIKDWSKELDIFIKADINKASWREVFKVERAPNKVRYTSDNEKVQVKSLEVNYTKGKVAHVAIVIHKKSAVYFSADTLNYYTDSLYIIVKAQKIRLLSEKKYTVKGRF